jgi:hypothetical protein
MESPSLKYLRVGLLVAACVLPSYGTAQISNLTIPLPGATIPNDEFGKPQLFFDARTTGFTRNGKQQVFDGDVIAIGAKSIVTADKVIVDQEARLFVAEGHVVIVTADQILTGDKIEFLLDSGDFRILGARMIVNDKTKADRIAKDVLGFSAQELTFEAERKSRLQEVAHRKERLRQNVRRKVKLGQDASANEIQEFSRYLEQEELISGQENPAFAHMTEIRRTTLRKRRDFWEHSKVADRVQGDAARQAYFRLEGDELTRKNGNDFNARIGSDASLIARLISNKLTWFLSDERCESASSGASCESTWLEHHDALTTKPVFVDEAKWDERGFARTWWGNKYCSEASG